MNERIGPNPPSTRDTLARILATVERVGFWGSILIPAAYLPVLYTTSGTQKLLILGSLIAINMLCLAAGQRYTP